MRPLPFPAAAVLGVACAVLVGCGGDRHGLIPSTDAASLDRALADVAAATNSGDCAQAGAALAQAKGALLNLPESVDSRLRARLERGIENLEQRVPVACASGTETEPPPETTPSVPTETVPSVPAETTPSVPVPTGPETTPSVPAETTPSVPTETTPPPDGSGGGANPDGAPIP